MFLRLDDPALMPDLLGFLDDGVDVITRRIGEGEILVGLLGSRSEDGQRRELEARVADWRRSHPHARVLVG